MEPSEFIILSGNSHRELANLIASRLGMKLGNCDVYQKSNKETCVSIHDSVRAKDVYIIQTGLDNNSIMELLILAYACKTSSAKKIVGVIPYLPYSKQCKMRKRGSIVTKLLAQMLCKAGFTHIITMDLHSKEIQGFFDVPVDNLRASPFLLKYIQDNIPDFRQSVIVVARNPGSAKKATSYAERLRVGIAVIHGEVKEAESDEIDGRYSPPIFASQDESSSDTVQPSTSRRMSVGRGRVIDVSGSVVGMPTAVKKEKPPLTVVGDVSDKVAIMVDDMLDDPGAFIAAAEALKERGARQIYILCTHGLMSSDAPSVLETSPIDQIVVTNTVPHESQKLQCVKIKTVDISILLAEAIRRIHHSESMSFLFKNVTQED